MTAADSHIDLVLEQGLYIGDRMGAADFTLHARYGIRRILNCTISLPNYFEEGANAPMYYRVELEDSHTESIMGHLTGAHDFIEQSLELGERVLVHCNLGVSRSSTIVISYLMSRRDLSLRQAFHLVRQARRAIRPNLGYFGQLVEYELSLRPATMPSMTVTQYRDRFLMAMIRGYRGPRRNDDVGVTDGLVAVEFAAMRQEKAKEYAEWSEIALVPSRRWVVSRSGDPWKILAYINRLREKQSEEDGELITENHLETLTSIAESIALVRRGINPDATLQEEEQEEEGEQDEAPPSPTTTSSLHTFASFFESILLSEDLLTSSFLMPLLDFLRLLLLVPSFSFDTLPVSQLLDLCNHTSATWKLHAVIVKLLTNLPAVLPVSDFVGFSSAILSTLIHVTTPSDADSEEEIKPIVVLNCSRCVHNVASAMMRMVVDSDGDGDTEFEMVGLREGCFEVIQHLSELSWTDSKLRGSLQEDIFFCLFTGLGTLCGLEVEEENSEAEVEGEGEENGMFLTRARDFFVRCPASSELRPEQMKVLVLIHQVSDLLKGKTIIRRD